MTDRPHLVVITGMSGAGRSLASKALEDLGFSVIDNLPADLIDDVVAWADLTESDVRRRLAVVVDTRGGLDFRSLDTVMARLAGDGVPTTILFLDADDEVLAKRFVESRRPHPVPGESIGDSIITERAALRDLRGRADVLIDTSDRTAHELREAVFEAFSGARTHGPMRISFTSFGFKHGTPRVVDLLFDVRFLPNPHWEERLRPLTGLDPAVQEFVFAETDASRFVAMTDDLLTFLIPRYEQEGKAYLTIAIGCTGGRHRSVAIAEELARLQRERGGAAVTVRHRDLDR